MVVEQTEELALEVAVATSVTLGTVKNEQQRLQSETRGRALVKRVQSTPELVLVNTSITEGAVARTRERFAVNQAGEIEQRPRSSKRWNLIEFGLIRHR